MFRKTVAMLVMAITAGSFLFPFSLIVQASSVNATPGSRLHMAVPIIKDPGDGGGGGPTITSEERYIDKYFQVDKAGATKHHIYLGNQKLGTLNNKTDLFFTISDHLGSSSIVTDSAGNVAELSEYYPYGSTFFEQTPRSTGNKYKFTGKERDSETALQYFGARYYDNGLGRFTAVDPLVLDPRSLIPFLSDPQRLNSYSYAGGNPVINVDPDGRCFGPFLAVCATALLLASNPAVVEGAWDALNAVVSGAYFLKDPSGENSAYLAQDLAAVFGTGMVSFNVVKRLSGQNPSPLRSQQASKFSRQADFVRLSHVTDTGYTQIRKAGFAVNRSLYTLDLDDPTSNYVSSFYSIKRSKRGDDFGIIDIHLPKDVYDRLKADGLIHLQPRQSQGHGSYDEIIFKPGAIEEINKYIVRD